MKYNVLVELYKKLEATTKKLEKRDILAMFYKSIPIDILKKVILLSMGEVYPKSEQKDLGIASEMMKRAIMVTYGISDKEFNDAYKRLGDLGMLAQYFAKHKKQITLGKKSLDVDMVFNNIRKLPEITGVGSQEKKINLIKELLAFANGDEAKYVVRTILNEMRIGVAEGLVRDAIALAFGYEPKDVEDVYNVVGDFGKVAELAKNKKLKAEIKMHKPIRVMLAERAPDLRTAIEKFEHPCLEVKYDGFRIQIHKHGDEVKIFSRRLDDVTNQFPEIVRQTKKYLKAKDCIVEGEVIAIKDGRPRPFQELSRRIQRKYEIEKMIKEIPVQTNLFDIIFYNRKNMMGNPLRVRWNTLKKMLKEKKEIFQLAEHIETKDMKKAEAFYKNALVRGYEGVMVKNLDAHYQPGKRVGYWLKVKPIMDPLDLVIIGGTWGTGKRANWIGSVILGALDPKTGKFLSTGMMGSGLTEEELEKLTKKMKGIITKEHGREVEVKPKIVVEVGYEEIQKSPKYETGYALRFPKLLRFREDEKRPEDVDTVKTIEKLFKQQRGHSKT